MKNLLPILILILLVGCPTDSCNDSITNPDLNPDGGVQEPPGNTCTATDVECEFGVDLDLCQCRPNPDPEPINPGPQIDLRSMDGFSAFAVCGRDELVQRQMWRSARNRGYGYGRVLSESFGWSDNKTFFRVAGKAIKYKRNNNGRLIVRDEGALKEYKTCMRIAAEEGMGMLVMGIVTSLRDSSHGGNDEKREAWLNAIGNASRGQNNIAFETANEPWHPRSHINRPSFLAAMYRVLKNSSGGHWVSADQNLGAKFSNTDRYRYDFRQSKSDGPDFHPWRNPDPDASDIRDIIDKNNGWALLSETTSWTANEADLETFGWLVTTSRSQIQTYMNRCSPRDGCSWVFHSIEGLFTEGRFTWMPQRGNSPQLEPQGIMGTARPQVYMN